jgi:tetratricopeptide (TPR) repeat protein
MRLTDPLRKGFLGLALIGILFGTLPVSAQELVAVSDITGGSSVFVFRSGGKAPKKFTARAKTQRTKAQRIETVKKFNKQFTTLAKTAPQRAKSTRVDPNTVNVTVTAPTLKAEQASKLFAGIGEYYIEQADLDNSVRSFRESVQLDPKNKTAQAGLSEALAMKGNELLVADKSETARAFFEEAIKNNPNNSAAYFGLGEVFANLDKDAEAIQSYEKALLLNKALTEIYVPLGILYYQGGDIAKADQLLTQALATSSDSADTQHFLGLIRFAQNRNEEALAAFKKAQSLDPAYAEAYYYAGETQVRLGKNSEAIEEYRKAVAAKPNYLEAMLGLGGAYYETEKYPEAIDIYKQVLRLKNDNIEAYSNLGDAYRQIGSYNEAESNYNMAITFIGRSKDFSKEEAAEIYSKHGYVIGRQCDINTQKGIPCKWPLAIKSLESAVALTQNTVDYSNLGWAYYKAARVDMDFNRTAEARAKLEQAKINLEKVVALNPAYIEAPLLNLGMTLSDLGDFSAAIPVLQRAIDKKPDWVFAINELGSAYYGQKNYKEASKQFRKAIDKDGKYVWGYYNLAQTEYDAGNKAEAKKAYEKLKQLNGSLAARLVLVTKGGIAK